jgi:hypothetical protein
MPCASLCLHPWLFLPKQDVNDRHAHTVLINEDILAASTTPTLSLNVCESWISNPHLLDRFKKQEKGKADQSQELNSSGITTAV